jgi:hypothetical protein
VKRHDADAISLVFGLIFLGLGAGWGLVRANVVEIGDLPFAGPILLVLAGAIGLVVSLRRGQRSQPPVRPVEEELAEETDETLVLGRRED